MEEVRDALADGPLCDEIIYARVEPLRGLPIRAGVLPNGPYRNEKRSSEADTKGRSVHDFC